MIYGDPRMQPGAYITDGADLYEVIGVRRGPGALGSSAIRIGVQNCRNLRHVEFLPDKVRGDFHLVRNAPVGQCPNVVEDILWDTDLAA
jgi:hypothetical protein